MDPQTIREITAAIIPVLLAITLHEVAHGWAALKFGDRTAQMLGRLSINPLKHIDPIGTVLVPLLAYFLSGFIFGWAKPVPVNSSNLRNPKTDMAWVAIAGPLANLLMAIGWALVYKFSMTLSPWLSQPLVTMAVFGININIVLAALNMLPLPPLDGGRVLSAALPNKLSWQLDKVEPYGFFILIALLATGLLHTILNPILTGLYRLINSIT
jgi:Zn-dependent protease